AMLGSVIALQRGQHMCLTVVVEHLPPWVRRWADAVAAAVIATFVLLILHPAYDYAAEQWSILTPSLGIHGTYRASALAVGGLLMLVFALLRLVRQHSLAAVLGAVVPVALVAALLPFSPPVLDAIGDASLLVFFVGMIGVLLFLGVPIAFCFGTATFCYIAFATDTPVSIVVDRMDEGMSQLILLAIPTFVFLGMLMEACGMAESIVAFLASLVGRARGGLSYVLMGGMYLVSGISGSKAADMAAIAPVLFPEMRRRGAQPGELTALLAASAAMSETIPPSLVLIAIGSVTGVSIGALFTAGLLPALVVALVLCAVARLRSPREDLRGIERPRGREVAKLAALAAPGLALPFLIRSAVIEGVATATEVSTLGIIYTMAVGVLFYRRLEWRRLYPILVDTAAMSGAILLIIGTATSMAWALAQSGFSSNLVAVMAQVPGGTAGFLAVSILAFVVLGSVLEGIPAVVLFGPLLFPIARQFHVHEVHYAMIVVLAMGVGLFAPPFGVGYYTACAIGKVDPSQPLRAMGPYVLALLAGLVLVAAVPAISLSFL
ncbi:MAG TPA: TRAP transporter large permease subunit, partial [Acetobacteraceae bacterium]|nr:TRAP transporter large permease subunit [Acetobacteraceae bacterium]